MSSVRMSNTTPALVGGGKGLGFQQRQVGVTCPDFGDWFAFPLTPVRSDGASGREGARKPEA